MVPAAPDTLTAHVISFRDPGQPELWGGLPKQPLRKLVDTHPRITTQAESVKEAVRVSIDIGG